LNVFTLFGKSMVKPSKFRRFLNYFSTPGRKKFLKIGAIVVISLLIVFLGVRYYLMLREKTRNPWDFVPDNALAVIQVNNVQEFVSGVTSNPLFADFGQLLNSTEIQGKFLFFDSLFATKEQVQEAWYEGNLLISFNFMGGEKFETILIKPLAHPGHSSRIIQFFEKHADHYQTIEIPGHKDKVQKYSFNGREIIFGIREGVCLMSGSQGIIQNALRVSELKKSSLEQDTDFMSVRSTSGKNCMANLYVNYRFVFRFLSTRLNGEVLKTLDFLNHFGGWGAYDIHTGDQKINLTGYTSPGITDQSWLGVFASSKPQPVDIVNILPQNTQSFVWFGFDQYESFREDYKAYLSSIDEIQAFNNNLTNLKRRTGVQNINELIFPYIDNQMALFTIPDKTGKNYSSLGAFKIRDTGIFRRNLQDIAKSAAKVTKSNVDTSSFRNIVMTTIHADYMLFDLFGKLFSSVEKTSYAIYNGYWIVGSSHDVLKEYLNQVVSGRVLPKNQVYEEFSQSVSSEANVFVYTSPRKIKNEIQQWFNEACTEQLLNNIAEFERFEGIGIQFSAQNSMFLSGISFFRASELREESTTGWEITLDGQVSSGPWFVEVADQVSKNIIVFDAFNNMYFVTDKGEVLWKIPVSERPVSRVYAVDALKNGKYQYLFNSENSIYLIDRNGKNVDNFPVKLPVQAAGPINVFDYDKTREYRIVFIGTDNVIYNYNMKGEPTSGWEKPSLKSPASQQVKHIRLINSDALIVRDNENRLHFYTRRGLPMFDLKDMAVSQYSEVYAAPKLCRCYITTTSDGQIVMIGTNGETELKIIHEAGPGHIFMYEDMDRDGQLDYIFIEKGKAYIFDQNSNLISGPEIGTDAGRKAGYIKDSPYGPLIYVYSSDGSEIYFINKSGRILPDETFMSSHSADFHLTNDAARLFIASARGTGLFLYVIE
jgi:hypothetical protein